MRKIMAATACAVLFGLTAGATRAEAPPSSSRHHHWLRVGTLQDARDAEVYLEIRPRELQLRRPNSQVVVNVWLSYRTAQHAAQGAYYQKQITSAVYCKDKTVEDGGSVTYYDRKARVLFNDPDERDLVNTFPIKDHTIAAEVFKHFCP
jgi:hypothetical protein